MPVALVRSRERPSASRVRSFRRLLASLLLVVTGAACVEPTNAFDPDAPPELQKKGWIVGYVVAPERDTDLAPLVLTLETSAGETVRGDDGLPLEVKTRRGDAELPEGLPPGEGAAFAVEVTPGSYTLVFEAARNDAPLLEDRRESGVVVAAGETVRRDVTPAVRDASQIPGSVEGALEGADGPRRFVVRLVPEGAPRQARVQVLEGDATFRFANVPAGSYRVVATGEGYAPATSGSFQVAEQRVTLEPLRLLTLGRLFTIDDFRGDEGLPPFAPYLPSSPAHIAIAPLSFLAEGEVSVYARAYAAESPPADAEAGFTALTGGGDQLEVAFDVEGGDGPRTLFAELRLCFAGGCVCPELDDDGGCLDPAFQPPLSTGPVAVTFVLDTTAPRALRLRVSDDERFDFTAAPLEDTHAPVVLSCAHFGSPFCEDAQLASHSLDVSGELVDDTSRVIGFAITVDDETAPSAFTPVTALGSLVPISGSTAPLAKEPGEHVVRLFALDAAGNTGLVDARRVVVDVEGIELVEPALTVTGVVAHDGDDVIPGAAIEVDLATTEEAPVAWQLVGSGEGRVQGAALSWLPYTGPVRLDVSGAHRDAIGLGAIVEDAAGNRTRAPAVSLRLWRSASIAGRVSLEERADVLGADIALVDAAGTELCRVTAGASVSVDVAGADDLACAFEETGAFSFTAVPAVSGLALRADYTVRVLGPAPFGTLEAAARVEPLTAVNLGALPLALPRGGLVGRFVLEGAAAGASGGISVVLEDAGGGEVAAERTRSDGSYRFGSIAVGSGYRVTASAEGFAAASVSGLTVEADVDTVVAPDALGAPSAVELRPLDGDFRLCAPSASFVVDCTPLLYTNLDEVQIGGVSLDGISAYRVATSAFDGDALEPAFVPVELDGGGGFVPPRVSLATAAEGDVSVFLQLRAGDTTGDVLEATLVRDLEPPSSVTVTLVRGADALVDGFTRETFARVVVGADAGAGAVAPLGDARVAFADAPPATLPDTRCSHGVACALPFHDAEEGPHTAYAYSCDAAGNCSAAPATVTVVVDRTPPSVTHGAAVEPSAPYITPSGPDRYVTRSAQIPLLVSVGQAANADGTPLLDAAGTAVPDALAMRVGRTPTLDGAALLAFSPLPAALEQVAVPAFALPATDGTYPLYVQLVDAAGNATSLSPSPFALEVTLDTVAPTVSFTLEGGAAYTNDTTVRLDVTDPSLDPAVRVQLSQDGLFDPSTPGSLDERSLPLIDDELLLSAPPPPAGDGVVTVFARFFDRAGNVAERSDAIFLDRSPPSPFVVACASCSAGDGVAFTTNPSRQVVVDTVALDNSGAIEAVRTRVRLPDLGFEGLPLDAPYAGTTTVTLSVLDGGGAPVSVDGSYAIDVSFVDAAGNESAPTTLVVVSDLTAPSAPSALTVAASEGRALVTAPAPCSAAAPCTNDDSPLLSFAASSDAIDTQPTYFVELTRGADFDNPLLRVARDSGAAFELPTTLSDGTYQWRVRAMDDAGNAATSAVSTLTVDTTPPATPSLLPLQSPVSQSVEASVPVVWSDESSSGATGYRLELATEAQGFDSPLLSVTEAGTSRDVHGLLTSGDDVRHLVRVAAVDALGNQSAFASGSFVHDDAGPCSGGAAIEIDGADPLDQFAPSPVVTVSLVCAGGGAAGAGDRVQIACDGTLDNEPVVGLVPSVTCVLPAGDGARTVVARFFDAAGNSTTTVSDSITVDTTPPSMPVLSTPDSITSAFTFPVVLAEPSSDTNFSRHEILDGATVFEFTPLPLGATSFDVDLPNDQTYSVRVRGVDAAGNRSAEAVVRITRDTVPPTPPSILGEDTVVYTNADTFTYTLAVGSTDANFAGYQTCRDFWCLSGVFVDDAGQGTFTSVLGENQTTRFGVRGVDRAGNVSPASFIDVVEDSLRPRPIALEPLPELTLHAAPSTGYGVVSQPFVDVFIARNESTLPLDIDENFDHFEVRASHPTFRGFVPLCAEPTELCEPNVVTDDGSAVYGPDHLITLDGTVVGFRVPVARGETNVIELRSVDKAANVSLVGATSTREVSRHVATSLIGREHHASLFGDQLLYVRDEAQVFLHEPGNDMLFGTPDDVVVQIADVSGLFFWEADAYTALGPDVMAYVVPDGDFSMRVAARTPGPDRRFGTGDDVDAIASDDGAGTVVDESRTQTDPSIWRDRLVWREIVSESDSDILLREGGPDGVLLTADDTFARVADDPHHQLWPRIFKDHLVFLSCSAASEIACRYGDAPSTLVVLHTGPDGRFGTADDVRTELGQAGTVYPTAAALFTPETPGRPACRDVIVYGAASEKGLFAIDMGDDGRFDTKDTPVLLSVLEDDGEPGYNRIAVYDTWAASSDFYGDVGVELISAGPDGCLTSTADNRSVEGGTALSKLEALHGNRVLSRRVSPTEDLLLYEAASERMLWGLSDAIGFLPNADVGEGGVAYGGGAVYDFASHSMTTFEMPWELGSDVEVQRHGAHLLYHVPWGTSPLVLRARGADERFGTADDTETVLGLVRGNQNSYAVQGFAAALDDGAVAYLRDHDGDELTAESVPTLLLAGADGVLGTADDCERALTAPGYYDSIRLHGRRVAWGECGSEDCTGSGVGVFVAELDDGPDLCEAPVTVALVSQPFAEDPGLGAGVVTYRYGNGAMWMVEAGPDGRLTETSDNIVTLLYDSQSIGTRGQTPVISGDYVLWFDVRGGAERGVLFDRADFSVRTLFRVRGAQNLSMDGPLVHAFGRDPDGFEPYSYFYYLGLEP